MHNKSMQVELACTQRSTHREIAVSVRSAILRTNGFLVHLSTVSRLPAWKRPARLSVRKVRVFLIETFTLTSVPTVG